MTQSEAAKTLQASLYRSLPIYEHIQARVDEIDDGVRCSLPLEPQNRNHIGGVHAALQFALCEMTGALAISQDPAIRNRGYRLVVRNLTIDYLKPAMTDVTSSVSITDAERARLLEALAGDGKAELELDIELVDLHGQIVAKAHGRYHLSPGRSDAPEPPAG